jgi:hypothetical protein
MLMKIKSTLKLTLEAFNTALIIKSDDKYALIKWTNTGYILSYITELEIYELLSRKKSYLDLISHKIIYSVMNDIDDKSILNINKTHISTETEILLKDKYFDVNFCDDIENIKKFRNNYRNKKLTRLLGI